MKNVSFVCVVAVLLMASVSSADIRFHGSGSWDMLEGVGQPEGWQSATAPGAADKVRANWGGNTVTLNYETSVARFQLGVDESGGFHIQNGGTLHSAAGNKVGNNGSATGTLTIDAGGTVNANGGWMMIAGNSNVTGVVDVAGDLNINGHLWMATGAGSTATLDIGVGGVVDVGGMIGLGTINAVDPSGGNATLNVNDGGLLVLTNIHGGGTSIHPGSMLNLYDTGRIEMTGNFVGHYDTYKALGLISGDDVVGNVIATFDAGTNLTTVVVPEPATMLLLGLGGMLIRKRRLS